MIMQDALPGFKRFLRTAALSEHVLWFLIWLIAACSARTDCVRPCVKKLTPRSWSA